MRTFFRLLIRVGGFFGIKVPFVNHFRPLHDVLGRKCLTESNMVVSMVASLSYGLIKAT